jgi:phage terminase large subunit
VTVVSPSLPHLKKGAMKDFISILEDWGIYNEQSHNKTDQRYEFPNHSSVEFFGADEPGKARGPGRDILFCNEANLLNEPVYRQLVLRTRKLTFLDFNPADEFNFVYEEIERPGSKFIHSTYLNNLSNLSKAQIEEIESLKEADPNLWKVYGLGLRGTSSETIYTHWKLAPHRPGRGEVIFGQDFGYNVASALVCVEIFDNKIYAEQLLYETKLTTNDLIERYKQLEIPKHQIIYCDAAEPKTIEELQRAGYNAQPADKDVTEGIRKVKGMPLFITKDSTDMLKEVKNYKWKLDKNDKVTDEPVKFNDHCFSAGTMIETVKGFKPIERIKTGDLVKTSAGFNKVLITHNNGLKQVNKYLIQFDTFSLSLMCTPDHLIKTDKGWQKISLLKSGRMVFLTKHFKELFTNYIQKSDISQNINGECTGRYGNISMGRFRKVSMFITRMKTRGTISWKISNSLRRRNIYHPMPKRELLTILNGWLNFKRKELKRHPNGILAMREKNGINSMQKNTISGTSPLEMVNVTNVDQNISKRRNRKNFVMQTVRHVQIEDQGKQEVFDLTVANDHEYFANGLLVHNCMDALRYAVFTHMAVDKWPFMPG